MNTMMNKLMALAAAGMMIAGCDPKDETVRVDALKDIAWDVSQWLSAKDSPVNTVKAWSGDDSRAAKGTAWFVSEIENADKVVKATWMTTALGVYELYVNGKSVGSKDALKPGFTDYRHTRRSFTYDVTSAFKTAKGEKNTLAAEVSAGWWRDKVVHFVGDKSAFRGVLELEYAGGEKRIYGTNTKTWKAKGVAGPVCEAAIFDGEKYDARIATPYFGGEGFAEPEVNREFKGRILPDNGAEVCRRCDLAMQPIEAYRWKGVTGEVKDDKDWTKIKFGKIVKTATLDPKGVLEVIPGETLVVDFGQNCAGVPFFVMNAEEGAFLKFLPGEMLCDGEGARIRGNDGPEGSVYRENLRVPNDGMRLEYIFGKNDGDVAYMPRFTFFGYRYASITATKKVTIKKLYSVPVTSITKDMEIGSWECGDKDLNKFVSNVYWGMLSNYLSVPTDCPQRNERLGWTVDTEVFTEAGSYLADTTRFFHKWMKDLVDTQDKQGGFPGVAPWGQYGSSEFMRLCWSDAGIVVPYEIWRQFGDTQILKDNWAAMERYMNRIDRTKYDHNTCKAENKDYQWADWLSFEDYESCSGRQHGVDKDGNRSNRPEAVKYWSYLGGCYYVFDAYMMGKMAKAIGKDARRYENMEKNARAYMKKTFFDEKTGLLCPEFASLQTAHVMALYLNLVEGEAKAKTAAALKALIEGESEINEASFSGFHTSKVKGVIKTGFMGSHFIMDALTENGMEDLAYTLLLSHKFPSWLYSVDQGATTIWERWNSYVKETGFGQVGMNSFNHYAYGQVLAWMFRKGAGIAADDTVPGFKKIIMKPIADKRLGYVKASYNSAAGLIKSEWKYEGDKFIWKFTIPEGATALVTVPGETEAKEYVAGTYSIEK